MDLVKIGKYIAGKRKDLGMTQKQLAEKLGMSDKSVSKWERGVPIVKDTTPNMMNPRLYTTSYNKP